MTNHAIDILRSTIEHHHTVIYLVLFIVTAIEGELVIIFSGVASHLGILDTPTVLITIFAAAGMKSFVFYKLGGLLQRFHKQKMIRYVQHKVRSFFPNFKQKPMVPIIISKLIYGVNHATLIYAGFAKIKPRIFIQAETIANLLWVPAFFGIGYYFSANVSEITRNFQKFSLYLAIFVIGFFALEYIIRSIVEFKNTENDGTE